ncbi:fatty acyl-CoA reductase wat-like [Diabrotica undecimpunctata]|uniref:fatty acyl-CoA reductase wat-like n=1 Tax=Diabrotica undecimpunctata TaxID=50387 RepID=UPI003B636D85
MAMTNEQRLSHPPGADITIDEEKDSEICKFYKDTTVLITGATGYLGKLVMEKLLRSCDVKKIFIIIREKKGKDPQKRFDEIFDEPCFEPIKRKNPTFKQKIQVLIGDAQFPNFGLCDEDIETLKAECQVVFHYAATVRFDEKIRTATYINIRAVRDLIKITKEMKHLKAFLHCSTAYSNCIHPVIEEKFYDPPVDPETLINLVDTLDENTLLAITPGLLGKYPNTYTFTKCIAEDIVKKEAKNIPAALFRPSIVIATAKEPIGGWINNVYGATGVLLGAALGVLRVMQLKKTNNADLVPADFVVNSSIAAAWDVACAKNIHEKKHIREEESKQEKDNINVYNYVSTPEKPISWSEFENLGEKYGKQIPSEKCIWYYFFFTVESYWVYALTKFFLHTVPANVIDFLARCIGKEPMMVKGYQKINKFAEILAFFGLNSFKFSNQNVQSMWKKLNEKDKDMFEFSMANLDWSIYFRTYVRGSRLYLLQDTLDTVPKGKVKYYKLMFAHYALLTIFLAVFIKIFMILFNFIFN